MLLLNIEGSERVLAVRLDDPSPGYAEDYAARVALYVDPAATVRFAEVDVMSVAEYGPGEIAAMLADDPDYTLDIPQRWERVER